MQINNTDPFEVVFTLVKHPYFGVLVEANAVLLNPQGGYTLSYQRIRKQNTAYFRLDPAQEEAVKWIEETEVSEIMKRYYKGSKRIRPEEFFLKHYNQDLHKEVRKFIESRLIKILELIKNYPLFMPGKLSNPAEVPVKYSEESATLLFHFRRDETGTNYFATIKQENEKIEFSCNGSELITSNPAWLLAGNKLVHFKKFVEGSKIKPFLTKKFIRIEPRQEESYMDKFVKPLLENYDVYAVGFDIVTEHFRASPILKLAPFGEKRYLTLQFKYGDWTFPYHVGKQVNVTLEKKEGNFVFHRIRRSRTWEEEKIALLKDLGLIQFQGSLFNTGEEDADLQLLEWINRNSEALKRAGFSLVQEPGTEKFYLGNIELEVKVTHENDWFDVYAVVKMGSFEIPFVKLRKHIVERRREFILPDGSIAVLPLEWFERFGKIAHLGKVEGDQFRLMNVHFPLLDDLGDFIDSKEIRKEWENLLIEGAIPDYPLPQGFNAQLRHYQKEGYNWLRFLHEKKIGPLLADDMGLGKTVQTLALLQYHCNENRALYSAKSNLQKQSQNGTLTQLDQPTHVGASQSKGVPQLNLFDGGSNVLSLEEEESPQHPPNESEVKEKYPFKPCIVIAPKSLLYNWQSEIKRFNPELNVVIYSGIFRHRLLPSMQYADIIICSYGTMRNDTDELGLFHFKCVVLDESQAIKNPGSQTARALQNLKADYRMALTGTPIENTILDVWSQMHFLNPGLLGSYSYFENTFIKPIEKGANKFQTEELRKILDPFVLRRTKKQVAPELPEKIEKIHYCEMTSAQAELYEKIKSQFRNEILESVHQIGIAKSRLRIFNGLMHLRQLALNPSLKEEDYEGGSGKDDEIKFMLQRAIESDHKVLLFSQFVQYLKIFENMLDAMGVKYCYLDGSLDDKSRAEEIYKFQNDSEFKVFLLSLRAGNSGINLTEADYVFLADPWWNPFTMKQAEDRAHRIGQKRTVFSYKFITKNTIEEKILRLQQKKTELAGKIIPDEDSILNSLAVDELEELLT